MQEVLTSTFNWYAWVILPIIVFLARICDVTLGTIRIIFVARGRRNLAPLLGFFEVLIWIVVIGQLVQNLDSIPAYLGYAGGFAAGNYVGLWLEDRLALGTYIVRIMTPGGGEQLAEKIHMAGFGVTTVAGKGSIGPVTLLYTVVKRKSISQLLEIVHQNLPGAFVTMEEVRSTERGIFPVNLAQDRSILFGRKFK